MATETAPPEATSDEVGRLADLLKGPVIGPSDEGYDTERRIWNGAIDRRPACIARCTGVADVVAAVRFAREHDLEVAVRSGGHGVGGHAICDGGLVIDLSPMKGIRVDPARRTARAEAGVLWGELDRETQLFGLATVGGIVTHTGIAGQLFKDQSLTVAFALAFSLLVALTLVPMLAAGRARAAGAEDPSIVVKPTGRIGRGLRQVRIALGRVGVPEDIGGVVDFLCSEEGRWVNAQRVEASGGMFL